MEFKRRRFTRDGEYIPDTGSNNEEPLQPLSFSNALSIPSHALKRLRNVEELLPLLEVGHLAKLMDSFSDGILPILKEKEVLEQAYTSLNANDSKTAAILAILSQDIVLKDDIVKATLRHLESLIGQLASCKDRISHFCEINQQLANELKLYESQAEGLGGLSDQKDSQAKTEQELCEKIASVLAGKFPPQPSTKNTQITPPIPIPTSGNEVKGKRGRGRGRKRRSRM